MGTKEKDAQLIARCESFVRKVISNSSKNAIRDFYKHLDHEALAAEPELFYQENECSAKDVEYQDHLDLHGFHGFSMRLEDNEVTRAVLALPEELKNIMLLHFWAGLNYREVATALSVPPQTILDRKNRALTRLSSVLSNDKTPAIDR